VDFSLRQVQTPKAEQVEQSRVENGDISILIGAITTTNKNADRGRTNHLAQRKGNRMSKIGALKAEIESLPSEEFAEIFLWLSGKR